MKQGSAGAPAIGWGKKLGIFLLLLHLWLPARGCILRRIINNSTTAELIIRSISLPGTKQSTVKDQEGAIIPRRKTKHDDPVVIDTNYTVGIGEYMRVLVIEKSPAGKPPSLAVCKKYRIFVDEKNKELALEKKDKCEKTRGEKERGEIGGEYEAITVYPEPINPDSCYIDLYLNDGANSLSVQVVDQKDFPTIGLNSR